MENKTVKELKEIAKERKIKYYYKLTRQDLVRALQPPRPIPAPRSIAQSPVPAPRLVSNDLISFGPARLQNRATRVETSIIDESFQDTTNVITPRPVPAPRPGLFSRFKTTAINAVNHGFNRVLAVIDPYVPTPVKNVVRNVKKGVGKTIKSLKGLVFSTPIPAPRSIAQSPIPAPRPIVFKLTDRSLKNITRQYSYEAEGEQQDASVFLERVREGVMKILRENRNNKVNLVLTCDMSRVSIVTGDEVSRSVPFPSRYEINLESTDVGEMTNTANENILENITKYNNEGSSWRVSKILKIDINMINYTPLSARSYINLPKSIEDKKAVIDMLNDDNECFKWCVTRALNMKKKNNDRIDKELIEKSKELHWEGIEFPVTVSSRVFAKFEKNNKDISVNVYGINEEEKIYPLHTSKNFDRKHHIDLLLISNKETNHYCLIKNFSR